MNNKAVTLNLSEVMSVALVLLGLAGGGVRVRGVPHQEAAY